MAMASVSNLPQISSPFHKNYKTATRAASSNLQCSATNTLALDPPPRFKTLTAFAPATVANLGPGFDFLGCAVDTLGDTVTVSVDPQIEPGMICISAITGAPKLTKNPLYNCAGIAAIATMRKLRVKSVGLSLSLHKGLPLGSGLGSSAASAAAAATAVNALFGDPLDSSELILAGLESEKKVSGYHADNIAPAILGGFVLIRSYSPFEIMPLRFPDDKDLFFVLVSPEFEAPTKKMREILPGEVGMKEHIFNSSQAAALVAAVVTGDVRVLGESMGSDMIVEPRRAGLIPGMEGVKKAVHMAVEAGNPYFRLGYNSLGAFATINHLHFQAYYLSVPFPVEKAPTRKIPISKGLENSGVSISMMCRYPVRGLVYEGGNTLKDLADLVANSCICLQDYNSPFNVLISDSGKRVFIFPQCYAEKQALGEVSQELLDTQVNPAVWEISGHMVLKRKKDYEEATEDYAWRLLAAVSLSKDRFQEVKDYIFEATGLVESKEEAAENKETSFQASALAASPHLPGGCLVLQ